jgi:DNA-directed RNA polymerase subunit RPC12/RpoP
MAKRMVAPDRHVAETTIGNRSYKPNRQGIYTVSNLDAKAMKAEGFFEASLNPYSAGDTQRGYTCSNCGFGSWFIKCSQCGHEATVIKKDGD